MRTSRNNDVKTINKIEEQVEKVEAGIETTEETVQENIKSTSSENLSDTKEDGWFSDTFDDTFVDGGDLIGEVDTSIRTLGKPENNRIIKTVLFTLLNCIIMSLILLGLVTNFVKYPPRKTYTEKQKGVILLNNWVLSLSDINSLSDDLYLKKEIEYANGNSYKINFYQNMLNTVTYTPHICNVKNIYGNDYIDKNTKATVQESSVVEAGEPVDLSYIDYSAIEINEDVLAVILQNHEASINGSDYANKLVDVFCEYMSSLTLDSIPLKTEEYVPSLIEDKETKELSMNYNNEDIYLDNALFSSQEFYKFLDKFSETAARISGGTDLTPTAEWENWNSLTEEQKAVTPEPIKYNKIYCLAKDWCGSYYLQNEYEIKDSNGNVVKTGISAMIGDGTLVNPAGLDTPVNTVYFVRGTDPEGNEVENQYPIKLILRDFKASQDAIDWLESKDQRNRGIDVASEVQYCVYTIEVVNLSDVELTINDNSILSDQSVNLSGRSGELFGLNSSLVLQPNESGIIESWNKSTELNKKYLIWGADFARRVEPVWFRVLAGNIDDSSEQKGVQTNESRYTKDTTEEGVTEQGNSSQEEPQSSE